MQSRRSRGERTRRAIARALLAGALAVGFGLATTLPGHAEQLPDDRIATVPSVAKPSKMSLNVTQIGAGTVSMSGRVTATDGQPVTGLVVVAVDGRPLGSVTTSADGSYGAQVPGIPEGKHTATATYPGGLLFAGSNAKQDFTVKASQPDRPASTTAAPAAPAGGSVITAKVTPTTVTPGGYLDVSGTLRSSANAGINQARIEISTSWGQVTGAAATNDAGGFATSLPLPALGQGEAPPANMTVKVSYAGDGPYPATNITLTVAMQAPAPTPPPPTINTETPAPAAQKAAGSEAAAPPKTATNIDAGSLLTPSVAALVLILPVVAVSVLTGTAAVAWRRHRLLPGERRGFGTDFGK